MEPGPRQGCLNGNVIYAQDFVARLEAATFHRAGYSDGDAVQGRQFHRRVQFTPDAMIGRRIASRDHRFDAKGHANSLGPAGP